MATPNWARRMEAQEAVQLDLLATAASYRILRTYLGDHAADAYAEKEHRLDLARSVRE
jgi:hypothetical protein